MRILMSALACEPGKGSELEVGFRALLVAARIHEVWVLTNKDTIPAVQRAIEGRPEAERIHLEGIEFGVDAEGLALLTVPGFHFYDRWQRRAPTRAVELNRRVDFHIVHHATLAAYWTRTGVAVLDKPLVWGPVGGGVEPPLPLLGELGWRGLLEDAGRVVTRRFLARFGPAHQAQRRAVVTIAQNRATLRQIRTAGQISVMTNATVVNLGELRFGGTRAADVLFVGRLVAWKGPMLALRAFRYVQHRAARLVFCGEGYERARVERAAQRWGIADRVIFAGFAARRAALPCGYWRCVAASRLLEEAGLCVAEALALGTPGVCLARGGPAEILRQWPLRTLDSCSDRRSRQRSSVIGLTAQGRPEFFLTLEPFDNRSRGPLTQGSSFRVPACVASCCVDEWSVRRYELLPEFHQPAGSDLERIRQVAADASRALGAVVKRAPDTPSHWRPIHGDLVPWNLREDSRGQLWLLDWEDAGWGPPLADYMRYIVAYHSLAWRSGDRIAAKARTALNTEPDEALREAARFWLQHRNFRPVESTRNWPWQKARDAARWAREHAAFRVLASTAEEITQGQKSTP
jgi:glycosyltransferase involved in cell wall biosynthesis